MAVIDSTFGAYFIGVVISAVLYGGNYLVNSFHPRVTVDIASDLRAGLVLLRELSDGPMAYQSSGLRGLCIGHCAPSSDNPFGRVHRIIPTDIQAHASRIAYIYLVSDIVNPAGLADLVWSLIVEVLFNAITALLVQCFLSMRVYRLSNKSIPVTALVMSSVIAEFVLSVTYVAKALPIQSFAELPQLKGISSAVNATTAVSDVLIAGCLCFLLQKSRTGFRRSDTMINKLMLFSLNTGLLTGIFAVASLISISLWPNAFIYIAFYFCVGLYCNSLLATLNARRIIRAASTDDDMSLSLQGARKTNLATSQRPVPNNISIKIDTTHELVRDDARDEQYSANGDMKTMNVV
ncbi:hypothetical protein F5141DRAFT_1216238 [Pisolithus sp. B1]|nr:hypothetical protein F5141DRAFT_1216238 [Pisolithus sp. B1]